MVHRMGARSPARPESRDDVLRQMDGVRQVRADQLWGSRKCPTLLSAVSRTPFIAVAREHTEPCAGSRGAVWSEPHDQAWTGPERGIADEGCGSA